MAAFAGGGSVTIMITPVFNGQPLTLSDQYYIDEHGDTLYIDLFRFYITNMTLNGNVEARDANSHLVDAEQKSTNIFTIDNVPLGNYTSISFTIGVDSSTNVSGANGGDLDPVKGMYWAWNSGYIMAKLEGHARVCKTLHHAFEFHIGGYMPPYNAARTVTLPLSRNAIIEKDGNTVISIKADAAAWLSGKLDLGKENSIVIPGREACGMADRYMKMFSIAD